MKKIKLSFVSLHNPLFMQGVNLGQRIHVSQKPMVLEYDLERKIVLIHFKGKVAILPDSNVESMDVIDPADLGIEVQTEAPKPHVSVGTPVDKIDSVQSQLIAQNRMIAAGNKPIQVFDPTKPAEGVTGVTGKRKIISHAELAKQMEAEKLNS